MSHGSGCMWASAGLSPCLGLGLPGHEPCARVSYSQPHKCSAAAGEKVCDGSRRGSPRGAPLEIWPPFHPWTKQLRLLGKLSHYRHVVCGGRLLRFVPGPSGAGGRRVPGSAPGRVGGARGPQGPGVLRSFLAPGHPVRAAFASGALAPLARFNCVFAPRWVTPRSKVESWATASRVRVFAALWESSGPSTPR